MARSLCVAVLTLFATSPAQSEEAGIQDRPTAPKAELAWLLDYEGRSTNDLAWDKRIAALVHATVPKAIDECVQAGLGGPPDPVVVVKRRFVAASACVPHFCPMKSFFWIDAFTGAALGACLDGNGQLTLGSRQLPASRIPGDARAALVDWLTDHGVEPQTITFVDRDGRRTTPSPTTLRPRAEYQPPAAGPSFDCGRASTQIESAICASSELSSLDVELWRLYQHIWRGLSTTVARGQLKVLEQRWVKARDRECAVSVVLETCLAARYHEQRERLGRWVPEPGAGSRDK